MNQHEQSDKDPRDIYTRVTEAIVEAIESGKGTYQMPWHAATSDSLIPVNVYSNKPYSGVNVVALWASAQKNRFGSGAWATYRQWAELGGQVRRGEQGTPVVFWKVQEKEVKEQSERQGEEKSERVFIAKGYTVFNRAQVTGLKLPETLKLPHEERIVRAGEFVFSLGADIRHGYSEAAYDPKKDCIILPDYKEFRSGVHWIGVLAHEAGHWSGSPQRLGRDLTGRFGSASYAMEELVAELSSAFILSKHDITSEPRTDHAGYVESWLKVLKKDKKAIFTAAAKAQQAVEWMEKTYEIIRSQEQERARQAGLEAGKTQEPQAEVDCGPELDP
jgi:antirestriction protein ArdC